MNKVGGGNQGVRLPVGANAPWFFSYRLLAGARPKPCHTSYEYASSLPSECCKGSCIGDTSSAYYLPDLSLPYILNDPLA